MSDGIDAPAAPLAPLAPGERRLILVLPAYNEAESLPSLFARLEKSFDVAAVAGFRRQYVVVNDGSVDATAEVLAEARTRLPLIVVTHEVNEGLGPTLRDGLVRAVQIAGADDLIVTMDADDTHPPALMWRMAQLVAEGSDMVIASRYRPGARVVGLSRFRELMSWGARALFQVVFPIRGVRDYTCGYRCYRAELLREALRRYGDTLVEYRGFHCMADLLLKLSRLDCIITELPMILRYDRKGGVSKMNVFQTVLKTLGLLARRRVDTWTGRI